MTLTLLLWGGLALTLFVIALIIAIIFRVVVPTNAVHIVQSSKHTVSYGKEKEAGNAYYKWPSSIPKFGVVTIELPVSVFSRSLNSYPAYDKDRVPFVVDIEAFYRISNSDVAAERVETIRQLEDQLDAILQGAARSILARNEINEILEGRGKFGEEFTKEVDEQLKQWGVETVKTIELMDIRDSANSNVIQNIMAKKKSFIEMESRVEVANNLREAEMKEIEAKREVDLSNEQAEQQVGERQATKEKAVGIANEQATQAIQDELKATTEKTMLVRQVENVRAAEIARDVQIVKAQEDKQSSVIKAEGEKQETILVAAGNLEAKRYEAKGIQVTGEAVANAEKQMQMAPVTAQIELAREIGANEGYQKYLVSIRGIEMGETVGTEQAKALTAADVKVISNTGKPTDGISSVMDLFSSKGGTEIASMLEGIAQTDIGQDMISKFLTPKVEVRPKTTTAKKPKT